MSCITDHDGHANNVFRIACTMRKQGDRLTFDLRDAHPQIQGMGNATKAGTLGAIATALLGTFGQELDWNAGLLGPVSVILSDCTIISAEAPSPVSGGSVTANWIASGAATSCVAKMMAFSPRISGLCLRSRRRLLVARAIRRAQPGRRALRNHVYGFAGLGGPGLPAPATASRPGDR